MKKLKKKKAKQIDPKKVIRKCSPKKRHRTIFSDNVDFTGWWIKSNILKTIAQLKRGRPDLEKRNTYFLEFKKPELVGAKIWRIFELENQAKIRPTKEALND
jgi:hypothetical protein